jgi:hypothetical protein
MSDLSRNKNLLVGQNPNPDGGSKTLMSHARAVAARPAGLLRRVRCQFDRLDNGRVIVLRFVDPGRIGHMRIGSAGKGRIRSPGPAPLPANERSRAASG